MTGTMTEDTAALLADAINKRIPSRDADISAPGEHPFGAVWSLTLWRGNPRTLETYHDAAGVLLAGIIAPEHLDFAMPQFCLVCGEMTRLSNTRDPHGRLVTLCGHAITVRQWAVDYTLGPTPANG